MPSNGSNTDSEENTVERIRRGQEVVRTTVELQKDLYIKMKEEVARSNTSIRAFLSKAANDRLNSIGSKMDISKTGIGILQDSVMKNPFAKKLLDLVKAEMPNSFGIALLFSKAEKYELDFDTLSGADLTDDFIDEICLPVEHLSGQDASKRFRKNLDELRRG